jgi:hypothetical protein
MPCFAKKPLNPAIDSRNRARYNFFSRFRRHGSVVEQLFRKQQVTSSNLVVGSLERLLSTTDNSRFFYFGLDVIDTYCYT